MLNLPQILLGLVLSTAFGYLALRRGSLTHSGWLGAIITGTLTFGFGGWPWGMTLITFFVTSSLLSRYKEQVKERRAGEKFSKGGRRDLVQALANGGSGAVLATAYGLSGQPVSLLALFLGVMATVTADTWATELGVLSRGQPVLITNGRRVAPGTSGGISLIGTTAAAAGGLLIGLAMLLFLWLQSRLGATVPHQLGWLVPAGLFGGLLGALADSLLGATVQIIYRRADGSETERHLDRDGRPNTPIRGWAWMNNDMVNFLSSLFGGLVALGIYLLA